MSPEVATDVEILDPPTMAVGKPSVVRDMPFVIEPAVSVEVPKPASTKRMNQGTVAAVAGAKVLVVDDHFANGQTARVIELRKWSVRSESRRVGCRARV
jgi:hypothetical protein